MTNDELIVIAKSIKLNKSPGPDGIPTVAIKSAIEACPDMFRMAMQMCLDLDRISGEMEKSNISSVAQTREATLRPVGIQTYLPTGHLRELLERIIQG